MGIRVRNDSPARAGIGHQRCSKCQGCLMSSFICSLQLQPLGELIENVFKITVGPGGLGMAGSNSPGGKAGAGRRNLDSQGSLRAWGA